MCGPNTHWVSPLFPLNLTPQVAESLGVEAGSGGVVVTAVESQSAAAQAGLRRGDIILEVNRKHIADNGAFQKLIAQIKPGENVFLRRGSNNLFLALKAPPTAPG